MHNALNTFDDGGIVSPPQSGVDQLINLLGVNISFHGGVKALFNGTIL